MKTCHGYSEMTSKYLLLGPYVLLGVGLLTGSGPGRATDTLAWPRGDVEESSTQQSDVDPTEDETSQDGEEDQEEDYKSGEDDALA